MRDHYFISYSRVDGAAFALDLADKLQAGPPAYRVWIDQRELKPGSQDWDRQLPEAIKTAAALLFVMTQDAVLDESGCKPEWVAALKYKKPIIPVRLHVSAELPFRLSSRQYIDFSDGIDTGLAQLRGHLAWTQTPPGILQELRNRRADAEYELPRADVEQRRRIEEDLAELRRRIDEQQRLVDSPQAVRKQTETRIAAGLERERQPERPEQPLARAKFVNPPPMTAPSYFQDRHVETTMVGDFLRSSDLRLMWVVGRGGVGKTAMVCRLLKSLESGSLPDDLGELAVSGIIYLSPDGAHPLKFPNLFSDLCRLLPAQVAEELLDRYRDPHESPAALMRAVLEASSEPRRVVLLDNFEDVIDAAGVGLTDAALEEALETLLSAPAHGIKLILTTRVAPQRLMLSQPAVQDRLDVDAGLPSPHAENLLRARDPTGRMGLRDAPDTVLALARKRTRGFPRALEALAGILAADRSTTLVEVLADTTSMPENVVEALVGEAFNRLDALAQEVMQALSIYTFPVPPVAVDYLLQVYEPAIDSTPVLARLVNMQFVRRDAGRYYVHQVDRDYALARIPDGEPSDRHVDPAPFTRYALSERAAEYFRQTRTPRETWRNLDDLAPQLAEFDLRAQGGDYDAAATVLLDIDDRYLKMWGHYRLVLDLYARVQGAITDPWIAAATLASLGGCRLVLGEVGAAIEVYEQSLELAREIGDRDIEGACLGSLGNCYFVLGDFRRATELMVESLAIARENGDRAGEGACLAGLGNCYAALSEVRRALELYEQALDIAREMGDRALESGALTGLGTCYGSLAEFGRAIALSERALEIDHELGDRTGEAIDLSNLAGCHGELGEIRRAIELYEQALNITREVGDRRAETYVLGNLGNCYVWLGETRRAIAVCEEAIGIAGEIGNRVADASAATSLGDAHVQLGETLRAIEHYERSWDIARETGDRGCETAALAGLASCHLVLGETQQAIDRYEHSLDIARETGDRRGERAALIGLGNCQTLLGNGARAIELEGLALDIARQTGDRRGECGALVGLAAACADTGEWNRAIEHGERGVGIADEVGLVQASSAGRLQLALANLHLGELDTALETAQAAPAREHAPTRGEMALTFAVILSCQGRAEAAKDAFLDALAVSDALLAQTTGAYGALDTRALALCGLAVVDDVGRLSDAREAFRAARAITHDDGVVRRVLRLLDALATQDQVGALDEIRRPAAGNAIL